MATSLHTLALLYACDDWDEAEDVEELAEPLYRRALAIREKALGRTTP